jgi:manganese-dependent inorganic pyrophosphatase
MDSVCSAVAYAHLKNCRGEANVRAARAGEIDAETAFVLQRFDVPMPELLTDAAGKDLILVDHNEVAQALPHIEQANILEIWEHHRIGDLRPPNPIVFRFEPVGATATLIAEQYFADGVTPSRAMAGIMLASILSDTILFRSPTVSEKDRQMASRLEALAGTDAAFGEEILRLKTAGVALRSAAEIVRNDCKQFQFGAERVGIAQVEVMRPDALTHRKENILREMRALREEAGLTQVILMITDVQARASDLWFVGERRDLFERALGPLRDDAIHLPGCMSRKKQVVPMLERAFAEVEQKEQGSVHRASAHDLLQSTSMKLREIMTTPVLTLSRAEPASDALARMRDAHVRHGVVVSGPDVVGVVSERDLGGPRGGAVRKGHTVADLMQDEPILGSPEMSITKAALFVREHRIGCLPIVEEGRLVGIVTRSDLLDGLALRRRRERGRITSETAEVPHPPLVVSPNRDKWP